MPGRFLALVSVLLGSSVLMADRSESQQHLSAAQQLVSATSTAGVLETACCNVSRADADFRSERRGEPLPHHTDKNGRSFMTLGHPIVPTTGRRILAARPIDANTAQMHVTTRDPAYGDTVRASFSERAAVLGNPRRVGDQHMGAEDGRTGGLPTYNGQENRPSFEDIDSDSGHSFRSGDPAGDAPDLVDDPVRAWHGLEPGAEPVMTEESIETKGSPDSSDAMRIVQEAFQPKRTTWPVWGAHAEFGMHNRDNSNFFSDPTLFAYFAEKDGFVFQSAYPSKKWINDRYATFSAMKKLNPSLRVALYIWPNAVDKKPGSGSLNRFNDELIRSPLNGNLAWFLMDENGVQTEHGRRFWKTNEADHVLPLNSLEETFSEAWWRTLKSALSSNGTRNLLDVIDGFYNDVAGLGPRPVFIKNETISVNGDYDLDGKGDPNPGAGGDLYRAGMAQWIDRFKAAGFPKNFAYIGNGGLDGYDHDKDKLPVPMRSNPLYGKWQGRQAEEAGLGWGLAVADGGYEIDVNKPNRALETRIRRTALMEPYLSDDNPWGMSFIWWEASCANTNPPTLDDYRFMRANAALSRGYEKVIYAISMDDKEPAPRLDEHKVYPGEKLPSWQPWGKVDETDASFDMRPPDYVNGSAEFYFFPYENVLWVFRSDQSGRTGGPWPAGDAASSNLPDPGSGYHYEFLRGTQDPALNRGGKVSGPGHGSVSLRQWEAQMLLRVKS